MQINKVDRKELKEMLVSILSKSSTFRMLSKDNEINPCHIIIDGMEFYIYIKNLSPAQLSNNNPDIWRIQLPIRKDFDLLKDNDVPFIVLGYDDENKVFTTWNPYWVKQRLNAAKSVSLYSRFSLQKNAKDTQSLQKLDLNNEGEVVALPCAELRYYLVNIKQFFPDMTEYVAMGSRKRAEANAAYHCLCDIKNIKNFASYLSVAKYSNNSIVSYYRSIKKLISEGYFSRNRKIFLACDSMLEYPSVINDFLNVTEINELDKCYHGQISNGLRIYIQYLLEKNNLNHKTCDLTIEKDSQVGIDLPININFEQQDTMGNDDVDWEVLFTDSNGKLTRIANPQLIDLLRPVLDTEYRKLSTAYNIVSNFYGDRFQNSMELKDWNMIFNQIDWKSPYYKPTEARTGKKSTKCNLNIKKVIDTENQMFEKNIVSDNDLVYTNKEESNNTYQQEGQEIACENKVLYGQNQNSFKTSFTKSVDWSFLTLGMAVPRNCNSLMDEYIGDDLTSGQKVPIKIIFEGISYWATIQYIGKARKSIQILWTRSDSNNLAFALQKKYESIYSYLTEKRSQNKYFQKITIPEELEQKILVKANNSRDGFELFPFINDSNISQKDQICQSPTYPSNKNEETCIKLTLPSGCIIQEPIATDTFIKAIRYAGIEQVMQLGIIICGSNMIVSENNINPIYKSETQLIAKGLYVNTHSDTNTKVEIIRHISEALGLNLKVEIIQFSNTTEINSDSKTEQINNKIKDSNTINNITSLYTSRKKIKVTFPNGRIICNDIVSDTFIEVIKLSGPEKVQGLNIICAGDNLVIPIQRINPKYAIMTKSVGNGLYVNTNISTNRKAKFLKQISDSLGLNLIIEIV
jgi:hypothetical protein